MTTDEGPAPLQGLSSSDRIYLEPFSILGGDHAAQVLASGDGLPLAGGPLAFTAVRIYRRRGGENATWAPCSVPQLRGVPQLASLLERISASRPALCGVPMDRPRIMGIVNVTPDSFYDGGHHDGTEQAIRHGTALIGQGADFLDVGGESTRPGAKPVSLEEELARVRPVIAALSERPDAPPISVDTRNAPVMAAAVKAGAAIINDVSALSHDPHAMSVVANGAMPVVLMHSQGDPGTMQDDPRYDDALLDVYDALEERLLACESAGIGRDRIVVDPGIGFGKTVEHNLRLMRHLALLHGLGCPVLLGISRKSTIGRLADGAPAEERMPGSLAAALWGAAQGVQILRVHDVAETVQAVRIWAAFHWLTGPESPV